uniref:Right handed beta helix domain-containing protein n=1 Tax=Sexangularia sp. CB-2014 TaxID=1486929 RepID=A0A7S1VHC9_9EUKA|mmetsp:Transcript_2703/g.8693  ORF Transcript_2703/g.8693 Transcript_2703/m.8693 type:complete len:312 (+) Transcript_2703:782-1717(+)
MNYEPTAAEAVFNMDGNTFSIAADNVVICGLTVVDGRDGISSSSAIANAQVLFNFLLEDRDEGVQLRQCTGCEIRANYVLESEGDGLNLANSVASTIMRNEVESSASTNAAIYVYGGSNHVIVDNYIHDTVNNDAIKVGASCSSPTAGTQVLNNFVEGVAQDGISIYSDDMVVSGNLITDSSSINGAIYISCGANNATVSNNIINGTGADADFFVGNNSPPTDLATLTVTNNCFSSDNTVGVQIARNQDFSVPFNFWNATGGPSSIKDVVLPNPYTQDFTALPADDSCLADLDGLGSVQWFIPYVLVDECT